MNDIYRLDRPAQSLFDPAGRLFEPATRNWIAGGPARGEPLSARAAIAWLQRESGSPIRVPVGVIGPREVPEKLMQVAEAVARGLAEMGLTVICGGRQGIMEAACRGAALGGGLSIGLLPEPDPAAANHYASVVIATGIGEARNALIARSALCLVVIGDSFGTLSEVALGRQFGKRVIGLEGAAAVDGVVHVADAEAALDAVAEFILRG